MAAKNCERYRNKIILAPMVKIGTLPTRLLSLRYGADLVYSQEVIDKRLLGATRVVNDMLGTVEYVDKSDGSVVFSTCEEERSRVVLQIGTCCEERALAVLLKVQDDVGALDVNMGCPKEFSLKGGMGAALLRKPDKIQAILTTLVRHARIPITCKIRVLATVEETVELAMMIESCGVSALAVHGRNVNERPQHANRHHFIKAVADRLDIPVIANGGSKEVSCYEDIAKFREATGASSVMLARAAEWNPSIFQEQGKVHVDEVIREYLKLAFATDNQFSFTKYTIQNILRDLQETPRGKVFLATQTLEELCDIWELQDFVKEKRAEWEEFKRRNGNLPGEVGGGSSEAKKLKLDKPPPPSDDVIVIPDCVFLRGHYNDNEGLPKSILLKWYRAQGFRSHPDYTLQFCDKKFICVVNIGGKKVMTDVWEKSKKVAEQGGALAYCRFLKLL